MERAFDLEMTHPGSATGRSMGEGAGISGTRENLYVFIGSGGYLGLLPGLRGSYGALWGPAFHAAAAALLPPALVPVALAVFLALVSYANNALTPWAQSYWKSKDPGKFILDEIAGYLVVFILFWPKTLWPAMLIGFLLFRVLDVIKIPPARYFDRRRKDAWGILLDDYVSGAYAALVLYGLRFALPLLGISWAV